MAKGYEPMSVRYVLLSTHYRQQLNFTFKGLDAAKSSLQRLNEFVLSLKEVKDGEDNADVKKMINMFQTTNVMIAGIVENMKYIICQKCSERAELYPNKDNRSISEILGYDLLAEFPFEPHIGLKQKDGSPFYLSGKNNIMIEEYNRLCEKVLNILK